MAQIQFCLIFFLASPFILCLNGNYIGIPKDPAKLQGALNKNFILRCNYTGADGDGQFLGWYQDGQPIDTTGSEYYSVKITTKRAMLTMKLREVDQNVKEWSVRTAKLDQEYPNQCRFGRISIKPFPRRIDTDRENETISNENKIVKREPAENITLTCILGPDSFLPTPSGQTKWEFAKDKTNFGPLPDGVMNIGENEIVIEKIDKIHKGSYRCERNRVSVQIFLHVKDRFAALGPFIGIVSTVIVLVIGILLLEKHQKAKKKAAAAADEGTLDQANNPLVPTGNKSVDNTNKKSAVNV